MGASISNVSNNVVANGEGKSYGGALVVLTSLFFMWGFITCMNDILIPFLKKVFELGYFQAMLVQFSFFGAYFIGSLVYFLISIKSGDPISRIGYKNGLLLGLVISAIACLMFYPAAVLKIYGLFLTALFVLGLGFTLLQIAANPYVAILGSPETASSRLNLSQAFNSFGTTIAPIIGGFLVFHYFATWGEPLTNAIGEVITTDGGVPISANGVKLPYLLFAAVFVVLAVIIKITKLPRFTNEEEISADAGALKYRHLVLGMIAIFMYVGGEVSIGSVLIIYMKEMVGYPEMEAKSFLAFYWGGAMIGRFLGAVSMSQMKGELKKLLLMFGISVATFFVIYFAVYVESTDGFALERVLPFVIFMVINLIAFQFGKSMPARTLMIFALIVIAMLITTLLTSGMVAIWVVLGIGLFNSIMWSNIFTLAIKDLGKYTSQGSSLLVMSILGGALIPLIQGGLADVIGLHSSFFVPIFCYLYLAYYGWKGHEVKKLS